MTSLPTQAEPCAAGVTSTSRALASAMACLISGVRRSPARSFWASSQHSTGSSSLPCCSRARCRASTMAMSSWAWERKRRGMAGSWAGCWALGDRDAVGAVALGDSSMKVEADGNGDPARLTHSGETPLPLERGRPAPEQPQSQTPKPPHSGETPLPLERGRPAPEQPQSQAKPQTRPTAARRPLEGRPAPTAKANPKAAASGGVPPPNSAKAKPQTRPTAARRRCSQPERGRPAPEQRQSQAPKPPHSGETPLLPAGAGASRPRTAPKPSPKAPPQRRDAAAPSRSGGVPPPNSAKAKPQSPPTAARRRGPSRSGGVPPPNDSKHSVPKRWV